MFSTRVCRTPSISSITSVESSSPPTPDDLFQIHVRDLSSKTISLSISPSTSIGTLKSLLAIRTRLPPNRLRLVFSGKHLTALNSTVSDFSISAGSTIHLATVSGGMPTKKTRCSYRDCKGTAVRISGDCDFCSGHFCGKHRLLEDHKCEKLEDCKKESHERNAHKLNSERTVAIKGI